MTDDTTPEFTDAVMARARPAREVLPAAVLEAFRNKGGRPRAETPKVPLSIRLDRDVVDGWKASGAGWQTRMNEALRRTMPVTAERGAYDNR